MEAPQPFVNVFHMFISGITLCCLTLRCCPSRSCMALEFLPLLTLPLERLSHPWDASLNWVAIKHVLWSQDSMGIMEFPFFSAQKALCWLLLKVSPSSMIDCNVVFHDRQCKQKTMNSNGPTATSINSSFSFQLEVMLLGNIDPP